MLPFEVVIGKRETALADETAGAYFGTALPEEDSYILGQARMGPRSARPAFTSGRAAAIK
jgi:hypothetical protein